MLSPIFITPEQQQDAVDGGVAAKDDSHDSETQDYAMERELDRRAESEASQGAAGRTQDSQSDESGKPMPFEKKQHGARKKPTDGRPWA